MHCQKNSTEYIALCCSYGKRVTDVRDMQQHTYQTA